MADTASMGVLLIAATGAVRENVHQGSVLLDGSQQPSAGSDVAHNANPVGFKGIKGSTEGVTPGDGTVRLRLHMQNNPAGGFRSENDRFAAAGNDKYVLATDPLRYYYGVFSLTGQLMKAIGAGENAFKGAFQESMDRLTKSARIDINQAAYGTGNGVRAISRGNSSAADTVINVDTTRMFRTGEFVDGLTIATGVVIEPARLVTAVDRVNKTITVSPALTTGMTGTTTGFVRASSTSTIAAPNNSWNREINGLNGIVDTGTLSGLSSTLYPTWAAYKNASAIGAISDDALRLAKDSVGFNSGLDETGMDFILITTRGVRSNYADTQLPLKRHSNTQTLQGGYDVIMFDENPIFVDDHCQNGTLYGLRTSRLLWAQLADFSWMDDDGAVLSRVPGFDRYEAVLYSYFQLMCSERQSMFKLTGIDDAGAV